MSLKDLEFQLAYLDGKQKAAKLEHMGALISYLRDPELSQAVDNDPSLFHKILLDAEACGYVHYSRLSAGMGLSDSSNASRWFKSFDAPSRKTPDTFKRRYAIATLTQIIERDITRIQQGDKPIGGLSIAAHPELEFETPFTSAVIKEPSTPKPTTAAIHGPSRAPQ